MAEPTARAELYARLSEVIGVESAGTLMSYLPGDEPATKSEVESLRSATTSEVQSLRSEFTARVDRFENRMDRFEGKFDARMDEFHHALLTQGRTYTISIVGTTITITIAGVVVAITQLL